MKTIGLIGGTTWLSTLEYYRIINETVHKQLGGAHSAHCILYSVDYDEFVAQHEDNWDAIATSFSGIAQKLERAGADFFLLCANTMHKVADAVQESVHIPLLHIVDVTAEAILEQGIQTVGLLGTKYTMEETFYTHRLHEHFDITTVVPEAQERERIHTVIIDELTHGILTPASRQEYIDIIHSLVSRGAEGVILGCTEIPLLVKQQDVDIPVFDTTMIHAQAAAAYALT